MGDNWFVGMRIDEFDRLRPRSDLSQPTWVVPLWWSRPTPLFGPHVPPEVRTTLSSPTFSEEAGSTPSDQLRRQLLRIAALAVLAWALTLVQPVVGICAIGLTVGALATYAQLKRRHRVEQAAPYRHEVVFPDVDLDDFGRAMVTRVSDAIARVTRSRAAREGHLPGWRVLLEDQHWQVAKSAAKLAKARRILGAGAAGLPEQAREADAIAAAIGERVNEVLRFEASVRELDDSLAGRDAELRRHEVDETLRTAHLAASDETTARQLDDLVGHARAGVDAAVAALRAIDQFTPPG